MKFTKLEEMLYPWVWTVIIFAVGFGLLVAAGYLAGGTPESMIP